MQEHNWKHSPKLFEVCQIMSQIVATQVSSYLVKLLVVILCTCVISNQKDLWFKKYSHVLQKDKMKYFQCLNDYLQTKVLKISGQEILWCRHVLHVKM